MKKLFSLIVVLALVLSFSTALAEEPVTLVYAEVNPADSIVGQTATAFKEKVEELSGGSVIIDIRFDGVLGNEATVLDNVLGGGTSIDMARISAFALTSYGCNKAKLLSIPYTFVSREHFWNFVNSDLSQQFLDESQQVGLRGLAYGEEGFRHFFFAKEVSDISSLKGLKIRVSEDPVMVGMVNNLGASATVVDYNELWSSLSSGVCDGAEQPIANYKSKSFYEPAPYLMLDGHTLGAIEIIITENGWNKLNDEQKAWVQEAAKYASDVNRQISESAENAALEELKGLGVTVVEVPDKAPWVEACQPTIESNTSDQAELYQQLLDLQ